MKNAANPDNSTPCCDAAVNWGKLMTHGSQPLWVTALPEKGCWSWPPPLPQSDTSLHTVTHIHTPCTIMQMQISRAGNAATSDPAIVGFCALEHELLDAEGLFAQSHASPYFQVSGMFTQIKLGCTFWRLDKEHFQCMLCMQCIWTKRDFVFTKIANYATIIIS